MLLEVFSHIFLRNSRYVLSTVYALEAILQESVDVCRTMDAIIIN